MSFLSFRVSQAGASHSRKDTVVPSLWCRVINELFSKLFYKGEKGQKAEENSRNEKAKDFFVKCVQAVAQTASHSSYEESQKTINIFAGMIWATAYVGMTPLISLAWDCKNLSWFGGLPQ